MPSTVPDTPAITELKKAARAYARAQAKRDAALADLQEAIRHAAAEGSTTNNAIIDIAGVGRQTVYDALKKPATNPGPPPADRPEIVSYP